MFAAIKVWAEGKLAYLNVIESINNSELARLHLSLLDALHTDFLGMTETNVAALSAISDSIRSAKYSSPHAQWIYEKVDEVDALGDEVARLWSSIREKSSHKRSVLDDDLAREIFKEETRLLVANHLGCFTFIKKWADEKLLYLNVAEKVSIRVLL